MAPLYASDHIMIWKVLPSPSDVRQIAWFIHLDHTNVMKLSREDRQGSNLCDSFDKYLEQSSERVLSIYFL